MASNRRPQAAKAKRSGRERDEYRRRLVASATPRPSGSDYRRKPKTNRWETE